ncbi:hypothetical protein I4F81_005380 [Pyropia yezoensis]|uniref:Uncharacterized protein n=1 Tax=Pyropia yezoensis TaxID=2788 RepID=A0ACC3BYX1_PYRYE|nr:hypothetical protein I4F81_005380 [Neopyropia yezoensis]
MPSSAARVSPPPEPPPLHHVFPLSVVLLLKPTPPSPFPNRLSFILPAPSLHPPSPPPLPLMSFPRPPPPPINPASPISPPSIPFPPANPPRRYPLPAHPRLPPAAAIRSSTDRVALQASTSPSSPGRNGETAAAPAAAVVAAAAAPGTSRRVSFLPSTVGVPTLRFPPPGCPPARRRRPVRHLRRRGPPHGAGRRPRVRPQGVPSLLGHLLGDRHHGPGGGGVPPLPRHRLPHRGGHRGCGAAGWARRRGRPRAPPFPVGDAVFQGGTPVLHRPWVLGAPAAAAKPHRLDEGERDGGGGRSRGCGGGGGGGGRGNGGGAAEEGIVACPRCCSTTCRRCGAAAHGGGECPVPAVTASVDTTTAVWAMEAAAGACPHCGAHRVMPDGGAPSTGRCGWCQRLVLIRPAPRLRRPLRRGGRRRRRRRGEQRGAAVAAAVGSTSNGLVNYSRVSSCWFGAVGFGSSLYMGWLPGKSPCGRVVSSRSR